MRPVLGRVWRLRAGSRGSPRPRNTTYRCAESLRRDRRVFKTLVKHEGLEPCWHPRGPKHEENACLCVFFVPWRLPKSSPEGEESKTLVNGDRIWGVFLLSFSCPLRFLLRASGFLFGAVLAAPSVPQGCLGGPFGVLLRAARGAQKWPPYRRDWLFVWSLWGSLGCLVGSRPVLSLFFWALSLMNSRWAREVEPQTPVWVVCSKPSCFTRFWVGSVCGGPAGSWSRWVLLGALGGSWGPLGGETQPKHVPKAFAATGVCSQTFVKYEVFLNVGTPGVQNYSKMHVCVFSAGAQRPDQGHGHSEASFRLCFAVAGGRPLEHQSAKHDGKTCRKPSSRQVCVHEPS